jgi:hypothetical protein
LHRKSIIARFEFPFAEHLSARSNSGVQII